MQTQADLLVGDTFLSAACIAYSGAFTGPYRATLVAGWIARCQELGIPTSPTSMLRTSLAPAAQVQLGSSAQLSLIPVSLFQQLWHRYTQIHPDH